VEFRDDKSTLVEALKAAGEQIPLTNKGNPRLDKESLEKMTTPLATMVQDYRRHYLMAHTYYENFLFFADENNIIHPNFQQGGACTGRLSCREPNSQNIPKKGEDKSKYPVRKCFIPPKGKLWFSLDWKQVEYRLMLDYAGEMGLIEMVKNGHDVHTATGQLVGLIRDLAKNVNFALLYGTGIAHFAKMIKKRLMEAKQLKALYFNRLPKVRNLIEKIKQSVMQRGYVITHFGRKLKVDKNKSYVGPNYLIQGGCADIMKIALVEIDDLLQRENCESFLSLTVHDEADPMIDPKELHLVEKIATIMKNVYQHKYLPMGVDAEYSTSNWHELKEFKNDQPIVF
jgi:DNA polymerase-1